MRIWALLSFFDEDPRLLHDSISRVIKLGVDCVAVCDGPYDLYPSERDHSPSSNLQMIAGACESVNVPWLGWTKGQWKSGNEVEKRNFLLGKVLERASEGDWLLVFDSDHMWEQDSVLALNMMLRSDLDAQVAEVSFADCAIDEPSPSWYQACLLYRAVPGMRYDGAHWRIRFPDGAVSTTLRTGREEHTARTLDLREHFRVRHTVFEQPTARRERQGVYYVRRDPPGKEIER